MKELFEGFSILLKLTVLLCAILSGIGIGFLIGDFRAFPSITEQCKTNGYIKDNHTTIVCSIEKKEFVK